MYYVNVITTLTGKYAVHMVNENVLAFLWVVLLGIQGFGKMSDKRHTQARTFIHDAFTDADRADTVSLLRGGTDPYIDLDAGNVPDATSADSGVSSNNSDSESSSGSSSSSSDSEATPSAQPPIRPNVLRAVRQQGAA